MPQASRHSAPAATPAPATQVWGPGNMVLHWLIALTLFGLFGLGLWMTGLDYYSPWYRTAPDLHRSIGVLLLAAATLRIVIRLISPSPPPLPSHKAWEQKAAHVTHKLLYVFPFALAASGYLISTADGRALAVFNWFEIPASYTGLTEQEEVMGDIHEILAWSLIGLVALHALGALKHHFIDKDATLWRMTRLGPKDTGER